MVAAANEVRLTFEAFHPNQRIIYDSPVRFRVAACGRRFGKTTVGERSIIRAGLQGKRCWWLAPTYDLATKVWDSIRYKVRPIQACTVKLSERRIMFPGGGWIEIKSTHSFDNLRGAGLDFVVLDESAFMHQDTWPQIVRPMLLERKGGALFLSSPAGRNHFYDLYGLGLDEREPEWQAFHFTSYDNPLIDPAEIDSIKRNTPSRIFDEEYLAEFVDGSGQVFRNVKENAIAELNVKYDPAHRYIAGLDWARDLDYTVMIVVDATTKRMVAIDRWNQISWDLQRSHVKKMAKQWDVSAIWAEANSIGSVNIEEFEAKGLPVRPFMTTAQSKQPLIDALAAALEQGDIAIQPDETLMKELLAYRVERLAGGGYRYSAPPGLHDDTVIACALAWHGVKRFGSFSGAAALDRDDW